MGKRELPFDGRAELPLHAPGTKVDRGYIGQSVPRANAKRLLQGRGVHGRPALSEAGARCVFQESIRTRTHKENSF
jgi:hypothetical protein